MRVEGVGAGPSDAAAELGYGIALGLAPQPDTGLAGADGVAVTSLSSWWNHLRCRRCGHTFRRRDRVQVNQRDRTVVHLEPGLGCAGPADAAGEQEEISQFRLGLLEAWPSEPGLRVRQLAASDWRIPRGPDDSRDSNVCLHCGHTFRAGEHVIVCPCRSVLQIARSGRVTEPACGRAVHRDPTLGLSCWESWRPDGTVPVCPVTQVSVSGA
ncbi:MAG TPA: hypothetical protein VMA73_12950 [Streptosporangiaceae bacterium]|nr:hypothetical protein [Streptosporangiaceae bacterium]